jgi:hypothetical protein
MDFGDPRRRSRSPLSSDLSLSAHTSWLNQIECWFSILSRQALQGASFVDVKQLRQAIDHFISAYNTQAAPFEWRHCEIKQQPLRDNIAYFCR